MEIVSGERGNIQIASQKAEKALSRNSDKRNSASGAWSTKTVLRTVIAKSEEKALVSKLTFKQRSA